MAESEATAMANTLNILLMGETGVGKSTFINSFANYVRHETFEEATKSKAVMLIPTFITVYDDDSMEDRTIEIGSDKNEKQKVGSSCTQGVKTYVFPIESENLKICLIDTPGLGDTKGLEKDDQNCEGILAYLDEIDQLHAICLLMKPSNDRDTALFSYCVRRILSQLHKSAADNVVFLFTNTKGSDYRPGATLPILRRTRDKIAADPPYIEIPINKNNVFCLDNESFKHLLAIEHGVKLNQRTIDSCKTSWMISCEEINRFLDYIKKLEPHNVKTTISVNKTREMIMKLSKPMADIFELVQENISRLKMKEKQSQDANKNIADLEKILYVPTLDLEIIEMGYPALVCTNMDCVETFQVGDSVKYRYSRRCCDPCQVGLMTNNVVGHWAISWCHQMKWNGTCTRCGCSYKEHMIIYYDTKVVQIEIEDKGVRANITCEERQRESIKKIIEDIKREKNGLEKELDLVRECCAKFAYFLQNNAITSSYDSFKEYILLSLERERTRGNNAKMDVITSLTDMLTRHENLIETFKQKKAQFDRETITEESVQKDIEKLLKLKFTGAKIKQILNARDACKKNAEKHNFKTILTDAIPNWFLKKTKSA